MEKMPHVYSAVLTIYRSVKKNNELEVQYRTKHKTEICIVLG